jgi:hypothetical protein
MNPDCGTASHYHLHLDKMKKMTKKKMMKMMMTKS